MRRLLLNIRCKVATTVTNSEDVSRIEHIVQRLESTFEAEVSVWCNRHNWTEHGCPKKNSVNWKCFSDVAASQKPISIELAPYDHVLLIPFEIDYESFIAVALVETSEPELMLKLADNWVGAQLLLQQNQELTTVNEGFIQQVSEDLEELNFLREISTHLEVSEAVEGITSLANNIIKLANKTLKSEQICLLLNNEVDGTIVLNASKGESIVDAENFVFLLEKYRTSRRSPIVVNHSFESGELELDGRLRNFIIATVSKSDRVLGWLVAANRTINPPSNFAFPGDTEFGSNEAHLLNSAAAILSTHMVNVELFRDKEHLLTSVVRSLVSAIEAKDEYTRGHSERVALYGKRLGQAYGFGQAEQERVYLSGLLHDVGKIAIKDQTLGKTSALTDEEFAEIKRHPDEGWAILNGLDELKYIMPGVLFHHERVDGKGYPDQLAGHDIPIDGRILAVADAFDAMTSSRPYRKGMPVEKALSILREGAGTQWDSELVDCFLSCIDDIIKIKNNYKPSVPPKRK